MAGRTVREPTHVVTCREYRAGDSGCIGSVPAHFGHGIERPERRARIAMAVDAPGHCERRDLLYHPHAIDATVACLASHSFPDVDRMIEVDEVRELSDACPWNRPPGSEAQSDRRELPAAEPDVGMTGYTLLSGWNARPGTALGASVAEAAIDAERERMDPVIERHRLCDR